ncbi:hypothetical protein BpHYR1_018534 [Brachionus plicatilis]|uniref:Uncharacterized protein n=1 Tax=Brachionus plicatilis TaxID=10195 RepID=A0A3M7RTE3_BRAPC|nr:hypothetical protein BpHYR1_018534 [Brachionus plicatilis]
MSLNIVLQNVSADSNFCFADLQSFYKDLIWVVQSLYQQMHFAEQFLDSYHKSVFPRSILQPQNPKHNFDAGNKHHLAHVKTFLTYTACVKVVFRVLTHVEKKSQGCRTKFKKHDFIADSRLISNEGIRISNNYRCISFRVYVLDYLIKR